MGLEALPTQWHFLSSSPRPLSRPSPLLVDAVIDGQRNPLTRRSSDASDRSSRGSSCRRHHASHRASADGEAPPPGFPIRVPWSSEKGLRGDPSSSLRRTESSRLGQGFPGQNCPSGLFRWKSAAAGMIRRAARFDDMSGDKWGRPDHDFYEAREQSYQGFERSDVDVANPINPYRQESGRAGWSRSESARCESVGRTAQREPDTVAGAKVSSAVDVTAPSFVKDRQFMDRSEHHPRGGAAGTSNVVDVSFVDQQTDRVNSISRPASLKRKTAKVCTSGDGDSIRVHSRDNRAEKVPLGLGAQAQCIAIPESLRNLRRRNGGQAAGGEGVCAIKTAFNSMVSMIRALQSYTLQLRQTLVSDVDVHHLMSMVHREMHSSFVWLFQQVFSCTPTLMVSVMILLANFTVFSLGNNVAMGAVMVPEPPTELVWTLHTQVENSCGAKVTNGWNGLSFGRVDRSVNPSPIPTDSAGQGFGNYGPGGVGRGSNIVAGGEDGDSCHSRGGSGRNAMFSEKEFDSMDLGSGGRGTINLPRDTVRALFSPKSPGVSGDESSAGAWTGPGQSANGEKLRSSEQLRSYRALLERTVRELELKPGKAYYHVQLDQETLRVLVAPVATKMESDDYPCFDRTDLEYQHAIRAEPANPMLLANYAQFLYAVRHDNGRAEAFFHRALRVDRGDGDILSRWASFLWLALKDRRRADKAYREAISIDPSNPYNAGSYAHFLWHADDEEDSSGHLQASF